MKTIKLPYKTDNTELIELMCKQYTSMNHVAYNRFVDGKTEKEIRLISKSLNNIETLDSWIIQSSINDAEKTYKSVKALKGETNIIFGNKNNFKLRAQGKISKERFKENRELFLMIQGDKLSKGNRKFILDIKNNKIIFKPKCGIKIELLLPQLRGKYKKELTQLELLANLKEMPFCVRLDKNEIAISFEFPHNYDNNLNQKRSLGIDLNPNYIGISVLEFNKNDEYKILHKQAFDLSKLTVKSGKDSSHKDSKYLHNKLKHETIEICKRIEQIAVQFNCRFMFIENLKNIGQRTKSKNKSKNRLVMVKWLKALAISQLEKRCHLNNIKLLEVNPAYSSIIGNLQHDYFDPINSSIEIARRGYDCIILKNKKFYPKLELKYEALHHWKKKDGSMFKDWNEIFDFIKNSKMRYRVSLNGILPYDVLSFKSSKSNINCYNFG